MPSTEKQLKHQPSDRYWITIMKSVLSGKSATLLSIAVQLHACCTNNFLHELLLFGSKLLHQSFLSLLRSPPSTHPTSTHSQTCITSISQTQASLKKANDTLIDPQFSP